MPPEIKQRNMHEEQPDAPSFRNYWFVILAAVAVGSFACYYHYVPAENVGSGTITIPGKDTVLEYKDYTEVDGVVSIKYSYKGAESKTEPLEIERGANYIKYEPMFEMRDGKAVELNRYKVFASDGTFVKENDKWFVREYATTTKQNWDKQNITLLNTPYKWRMTAKILDKLMGTAYAASYSDWGGSGDGFCEKDTGAGGTWSAAVDATAADVCNVANANNLANAMEDSGDPNRWIVDRAYFPVPGLYSFATGHAATTEVLDAATLYVYMYQEYTDDTADLFAVTKFYTLSATTTLATTDYIRWSPELLSAAQDIDTNVAPVYVLFDLNAAGLLYMRTVTANLGVRVSYDYASTSPANNKRTSSYFRTTEQAGTTNDPYIWATTSIPAVAKGGTPVMESYIFEE